MDFKYWLEQRQGPLPPPPPKQARLYRGGKLPREIDFNNPHIKRAIQQNPGLADVMGCWFTNEPKDIDWYKAENGGKAYYIDIPIAQVQKYNVRNFPAAVQYTSKGKEDSEFILPKELANTAKPL